METNEFTFDEPLPERDFDLTQDQLTALEEILDWFMTDTYSMYKVLSGYAGTGKTTLLNEVVAAIEQGKGKKVIVTATTNKAVKVLMDRVDAKNYSTIHSLLNIKPKQVGTKEIFERDNFNKSESMGSFNLVIVDECSMISQKLLQIIYSENPGHTKVLFCGDPAQLQPINEDISECFEFDPSTLTEVVRHGDAIAQKAKLVRQSHTHVGLEELLTDPEIVTVGKKEVWELFKGFRQNPDRVRMLCWTNAQVDYWNTVLRLSDYGAPTDHPWSIGDIVIANQPCIDGKEIIMMNSEEGEVVHIVEESSYYKLKIDVYGRDKATVRVVKPEYLPELKLQLEMFATAKLWKEYWKLKKHYHDIKHCYALTVHKSQGSTFQSVVMDWRNIHLNKELQNKNQLIYVAMTRAAEKVMIYNVN